MKRCSCFALPKTTTNWFHLLILVKLKLPQLLQQFVSIADMFFYHYFVICTLPPKAISRNRIADIFNPECCYGPGLKCKIWNTVNQTNQLGYASLRSHIEQMATRLTFSFTEDLKVKMSTTSSLVLFQRKDQLTDGWKLSGWFCYRFRLSKANVGANISSVIQSESII